jgi:hypothetical protein
MCRIDYADDYGRTIDEGTRTARKTQRCTECYRDIKKGEKYNFLTSVYDGDLRTYKTCQHCQVPAQWLFNNCSGYIFQQVSEEVLEHAEEYRRTDLARLVVSMNRKWKRFGSDQLMPVPSLPEAVS